METRMKAEEAAFLMWPILTEVARQRDKITYGEVASRIGSGHRMLNWPLGVIQDFCLAHGLPPLTILVVQKGKGTPGTGFTAWDLNLEDAGFAAVWGYPWPEDNPFGFAADGTSLKDLVMQVIQAPEAAATVYAMVPVRGVAQLVFRHAVMRAYGRRCAVCGVSYHQCLEAAHIIPWATATPEQRISPTNGICLCANHHRLFDRGLLTIGPDGSVVYAGEQNTSYTVGDVALTVAHHGKAAHLPVQVSLRPSRDVLAQHYADSGWNKHPWNLHV